MSVLVALCLFLTSTLAGLIQDVLGVVSARFDPLPEDVFRYRQHFGANLGSVFVLEKWMSPDMFDNGADKAELSAVAASVKRIGLKATRKRWEAHWDAAITDEDLDWLANTAHGKENFSPCT